MTTLGEDNVAARRARRVRALRWWRAVRSLLLMVAIAAVPIVLALTLTGDDDLGTTTSAPQSAEVLVRSFEGTGSTSTGVFVVGSNWVLKWRLDGLASDTIEISVRAAGGLDVETVTQEGLGAGEQSFSEGGAYRLVVSSTGDWSIRVLQVSDPSDA